MFAGVLVIICEGAVEFVPHPVHFQHQSHPEFALLVLMETGFILTKSRFLPAPISLAFSAFLGRAVLNLAGWEGDAPRDAGPLCRCRMSPPRPLPAIDSAPPHLEALATVPLGSKCKGKEENQFPSAAL